MTTKPVLKQIAIVGAGPAGLFLYKRLLEVSMPTFTIDIFEAGTALGKGLPYSQRGAMNEHITNVSGNEIPELVTPVLEWIKSLPEVELQKYGIDQSHFTNYKVFPRLLFGEYLQRQFQLLINKSKQIGIVTTLHLEQRVTDIEDLPAVGKTKVVTTDAAFEFDHVILCTGHVWPKINEGQTPGFFDSPYPPAKLAGIRNHPVALKGSALTAIDAIRTLARHNGEFRKVADHEFVYSRHADAPNFYIHMFSLKGLLPGIRFHLDDTHLSDEGLLSETDIDQHRQENEGFLSLDFIFENDFKLPLSKKDPEFYYRIKNMGLEAFVEGIMSMREQTDPFVLFKAEYQEAKKSIRHKESVHWKEMLAILSFAMNYPAKHFSAEDMQRLQKTLMPLISIVIAFVPQNSCEELIALYNAGILQMVPVGKDSHADADLAEGAIYHYTDESGAKQKVSYKTFVDCTGQRHLNIADFPFKSMRDNDTIVQAKIQFQSPICGKAMLDAGQKGISESQDGNYFLDVPGIAITDSFNAVGITGTANPRIYIMAVPFIGGFNPDYSGLDFCEEASERIATNIFKPTHSGVRE